MRDALEILAIGEDADSARRVMEHLDETELADIANQAVRQRCVLRVASHLEHHGHDLATISITPGATAAARLGVFLLGLDFSEPQSLAAVRDALVAHRQLLLSVIDELGATHPGRFVVVYGLALSIANPGKVDRQSSDIDLYFAHEDHANAMVESLVSSGGFEFAGSAAGRGAGRDLTAWKLSGQRAEHAVLVDGFVGGRPSSGHQWIPPFRLTEIFADATSVNLDGGGLALVPSREHMLVMLAEKVQRKGDFSLRRLGDALALTSDDLDWDEVLLQCRQSHVVLGLDWLMSQVDSRRPGRIPSEVLTKARLPAWERKIQKSMHSSANRATRQRLRSLHRRWWVTRYVRDSANSLQALIEVASGRFVKPTRTGFHFEGPNGYGPRR